MAYSEHHFFGFPITCFLFEHPCKPSNHVCVLLLSFQEAIFPTFFAYFLPKSSFLWSHPYSIFQTEIYESKFCATVLYFKITVKIFTFPITSFRCCFFTIWQYFGREGCHHTYTLNSMLTEYLCFIPEANMTCIFIG